MRTIADPLYGSVQITDVEMEILSTSTFQRLHNVKQLGQANLIFPGANYSRFSHSIGALRNAGKIIEALVKNAVDDSERNKINAVASKYRLAALLHDVGHFPFSHAAEEALKELNAEMQTKEYEAKAYDVITSHETFGEMIIKGCSDISNVLRKNGFVPEEISAIFAGNNVGNNGEVNLKPIISSELDCDRLDYLRRTSHFTGLPFGNVDIDYLISSAELVEGRICFGFRSKRSADHMLLARFHDYLQVVFHKKLIALEWSLVESIKACSGLGVKDLNISKSALEERIVSGTIRNFDDNEVLEAIKQIEGVVNKGSDPIKYHVNAVLYGKAAKQVFILQSYLSCENLSVHSKRRKVINEIVSKFCKEKGLYENHFHVWDKTHYISKIKPVQFCGITESQQEGEHSNGSVPIKRYERLNEIENTEELVYIKSEGVIQGPTPLIQFTDSIVGELANKVLSDIRVFVLPVSDCENLKEELANKIHEYFNSTVIDRTPS